MYEEVLRVLEEAGASPSVLAEARDILSRLERGLISSREAYYAVMGLAREELVPLTPRQVGEIRRLLGVG